MVLANPFAGFFAVGGHVWNLRQFIPSYLRLRTPGYRALQSFREAGGKIANDTFWKNWNEFKNIAKQDPIIRQRSMTDRLAKEDFVFRATSKGANYNYRWELEVIDTMTGEPDTIYRESTSVRPVSPGKALEYMMDIIETEGSPPGVEVVKATLVAPTRRRRD